MDVVRRKQLLAVVAELAAQIGAHEAEIRRLRPLLLSIQDTLELLPTLRQRPALAAWAELIEACLKNSQLFWAANLAQADILHFSARKIVLGADAVDFAPISISLGKIRDMFADFCGRSYVITLQRIQFRQSKVEHAKKL